MRLFWRLYFGCWRVWRDGLFDIATRAQRIDPNLRELTIAVAYYGMWAMGFLAMLSTLGIDGASMRAHYHWRFGVCAGLCIRRCAGAFLRRNAAFVAGDEFHNQWTIIVGEFEGVVEKIDLRALHLRTYDNRLVTIPDGEVFDSAVIANTHNLFRRREFTVGIGYEDDAREAIQLALQAVQSVEDTGRAAAASSCYRIRRFFRAVARAVFTGTVDVDPLAVTSECILRTHDKFNEAGITIPFNMHTSGSAEHRQVGRRAAIGWRRAAFKKE